MAELSDLFLTEKEKTLILLALDTHMYSMHQNGCSKAAIDIFSKLEERISKYSCDDAALIVMGLTTLADEADDAVADEDDAVWDAATFVGALTEEDALDIYEELANRLGDDPDELDMTRPTLTEQLQASLDMELNKVQFPEDSGLTSTQKLGIKTYYDSLPSDTEPKGSEVVDLEEVIKAHGRTK